MLPLRFFFPVRRFHYEAILEGDTHNTRDLGIPYISLSFTLKTFKADFIFWVTLQIFSPVGRFQHEATDIGQED